jgi:hydrogenase maturation protease
MFADEGDQDGPDVVSCHQLMPELAERMAAADLVVFVDAEAGSEPGCVVTKRLGVDLAPSSGFAHHVAPGALLAMSGKLYGRSPEAFLVSVGAVSFALGDGLSAPVAAALPEVIAAVRKLVLEHSGSR